LNLFLLVFIKYLIKYLIYYIIFKKFDILKMLDNIIIYFIIHVESV